MTSCLHNFSVLEFFYSPALTSDRRDQLTKYFYSLMSSNKHLFAQVSMWQLKPVPNCQNNGWHQCSDAATPSRRFSTNYSSTMPHV